ncbi:hypothetical protein ACFLWR_01595 [Chloroflexota bacterium]
MMVDKVMNIIKKASKFAGGYHRVGGGNWPTSLLYDMDAQYHLRPRDLRRLLQKQRKVSKGSDSIFVHEWPLPRTRKMLINNINEIRKDSDIVVLKNNRLGKRDIHLFRVNNN